MKTIIVIESAEELLSAACRVRPAGDVSPVLPSDATLIIENDLRTVRLQAEGFAMEHVRMEDLLAALTDRAGIKIHIT